MHPKDLVVEKSISSNNSALFNIKIIDFNYYKHPKFPSSDLSAGFANISFEGTDENLTKPRNGLSSSLKIKYLMVSTSAMKVYFSFSEAIISYLKFH